MSMKMLWPLIVSLFIVACNKPPDEVVVDDKLSLIQEYEPSITEEIYIKTKGSKLGSTKGPNFLFVIPDTSYTSTDLLDFLAVYGTVVPDVAPDFMNYYQDIGSGHVGAKLDNLTTPEDTTRIYEWYSNGDLIYVGYNLPLVEVSSQLECEGLMMIKLKVIDPATEAEYEKEQWSYIEYLFIPDSLACECQDCPNYWDVFPIPTTPSPYQYQTKYAKWDLDQNNLININDLLILLSYYSE